MKHTEFGREFERAAKKIMGLPEEQQKDILKQYGVAPIESYYNRLSVEHNIPLPVAEAMVRIGAMFALEMMPLNEEKRKGIVGTYAHLWLEMAPTMRIGREDMQAAVVQAMRDGVEIVRCTHDMVVEVAGSGSAADLLREKEVA